VSVNTPDGHQEVSRFYLNIGVRHHPCIQECSNELQQPLVLYPFGNRTHQFVVVDSIEEFLQVEINTPAITFGDVLLCLGYCLLGGPSRSKTIAVFGNVGSHFFCKTCCTAC